MLISYDMHGSGSSPNWSKPLKFFAFINGACVAVMLLAWPLVSMFVSDPIEWATWMRIQRGNNLMDALDYPFVLLWFLPMSGIAVAWVSSQSRNWGMAWMALTMPIMVLGLVFGWYYLAPPHLH